MKIHRRYKRGSKEAGQTVVLVALFLGLFLLAALAFAVDMGSLWFSRQMAQGVTDSACTAAAMDMLYVTTGVGSAGGFTAGTPFSCGGTWDTAAPTSAACVYAAKNMGGAASTLTAGTQGYDLHFTFPSSVSGLPTCSTGASAPPICNGPGCRSFFPRCCPVQQRPMWARKRLVVSSMRMRQSLSSYSIPPWRTQ